MNSDVTVQGNRLTISRRFNAPRAQVFGWWTEAEKYRQWSGCKEAVQCEVSMDFRVGGAFEQKMVISVNGGTCDFLIGGVYEEIRPPERIVYQGQFGAVSARVLVEFFEEGDDTRVVLTHEGLPEGFFTQNISSGTIESFDMLSTKLAAG